MNAALAVLVFFGVIFFAFVGVLSMVACDSCPHDYNRIDNCNDDKIILVCKKCGKVKKWRK